MKRVGEWFFWFVIVLFWVSVGEDGLGCCGGCLVICIFVGLVSGVAVVWWNRLC